LRGIRIQNIVNELNGEKIDVVAWNKDVPAFIANALSPAQVLSVELNADIATVVVPDKHLSLAIGKDGQNARLAAKLTGWRIDIKSASVAEAEKAAAEAQKAAAEAEKAAQAPPPEEVKPEEKPVEQVPVATQPEVVKVEEAVPAPVAEIKPVVEEEVVHEEVVAEAPPVEEARHRPSPKNPRLKPC
jgi:N utilization substance protein A